MEEKTSEEKRAYVRGSISIWAKIKLLDRCDFENMEFLKGSVSANLAEYAASGKSGKGNLSDQLIMGLAEFLVQLDEKMDRIINLLGGDAPDKDVIVKETLNISGSGIQMRVSAPVEMGQLLQISLGIPGVPLGMFKVVGEVVRSENGPGEGLYDIGVNFINISETERDKLIACSFSQQRKVIRQSKNEVPDTGESQPG